MFSTFKKLTALIDDKLKRQLMIIYFISIIGTFLETLGIGIILPILKIIVEGSDFLNELNVSLPFFNNIFDFLLRKSQKELIVFLLILVIFVFLIKTIFFLFLIDKQTKFSHLVESELARNFFSYYLHQDYLFHIKRNSSKLFSNITEEIKNFRLNLIDPFLIVSTEIIFLLALSTLLIFIEPIGSIIGAFIIIMISIIYINFTRKKIAKVADKRQIHQALKIQHLRQGLNGIKEIKISGKEKAFLSIFDKHNLETVVASSKLALWTNIPRYILEFISIFGLSILVIIMVQKGVEIKSLLPTFGVFVIAIFRFLPSASKIVQSISKIRFGTPSADLLKKEISLMSFKKDKSYGAKWKKDFKFSQLSFEDVSFKYPTSSQNILNNIKFQINRGDKIGIIGASGSGKSTLIDIFTGLVNPSAGKIYLNNQVAELNDRNWFNLIGYSPQFIFLADDTIINNIAFGVDSDNLQLESAKKAYEIAEMKNFINTSTLGLKTKIGEFGVRLSGGQRQRIGIARAVYSDPQILVLDESTSAIDIKTEEKIIDNLNSLTDKTVIIISHRLSTLKNCNKVFEIKNGNLLTKIIKK